MYNRCAFRVCHSDFMTNCLRHEHRHVTKHKHTTKRNRKKTHIYCAYSKNEVYIGEQH